MNNTLRRYEPDNELFRNIMLLVVCFVFALFYLFFKTAVQDQFDWYDWLTLGLAATGMLYFYSRVQKQMK
jgi:TRAP-type uncharacterized transport system fused permease subunit